MKNILRKIGVIGIIIAMLAPFIELPVVKAANEECTDHTVMQLLFLDIATTADDYKGYAEFESGYTTYTYFANLFPNVSQNKKINIINVEPNYIVDDSVQNRFYEDMKALYSQRDDKTLTKQIGSYETVETGNTNYVTVLHGNWSSERDKEVKNAGWYTGDSVNTFKEDIFQTKTKGKLNFDSSSVTFNGARYSGESFSGLGSLKNKYTDLKSYFEAVANRTDEDLNTTKDNITYFSVEIKRKFSTDALNKLHFGYECTSENPCTKGYKVYTTALPSENKITDSYTAFVKHENGSGGNHVIDAEENEININTSESTYWPAMLNIEYKVCSTTSEQWTLQYDKNTDDNNVTGMPSSKTETAGTSIMVDAKKPSRDGYTFQGWNTQKDGKGTSYNPDQEYKYPGKPDTYTLFAQWGKGGTEDQKKTGVMSYVVGFITTGLVASGIYLVAKKKNLFKQI